MKERRHQKTEQAHRKHESAVISQLVATMRAYYDGQKENGKPVMPPKLEVYSTRFGKVSDPTTVVVSRIPLVSLD